MKISRITGVLAVAALALASLATTGCAGTKAAYSAANTLETRAYVVTEHFAAVVHQAADLKERGVLKGAALTHAQEAESAASPIVFKLKELVQNYNAARTAETEVELQSVLDEAVRALADLVRIVKGAAGGAS